MLSPSLVILTPSSVMLSEAKHLSGPQGKLREGSQIEAQGAKNSISAFRFASCQPLQSRADPLVRGALRVALQ
jgi:hypothetical protein